MSSKLSISEIISLVCSALEVDWEFVQIPFGTIRERDARLLIFKLSSIDGHKPNIVSQHFKYFKGSRSGDDLLANFHNIISLSLYKKPVWLSVKEYEVRKKRSIELQKKYELVLNLYNQTCQKS